MVLSGVVKVSEEGQRNGQQAHHQIRNGQVKEKQLNRGHGGVLSSPAQGFDNCYHNAVTNQPNDEYESLKQKKNNRICLKKKTFNFKRHM